jgi:hypothetical protein
MPTALATAIVIGSGLYLLALGILSLLRPAQASRFLLGFASSARAHYFELLMRMLVGIAFVVAAPGMAFEAPASTFGWLLVGTTACLFLIPWRWHQRFAEMAVPHALRKLWLVGLVSLLLGAGILAAVTIR